MINIIRADSDRQAFDPYSHAVSSNIITDRVEGFLHVEKMKSKLTNNWHHSVYHNLKKKMIRLFFM